MVSTSTADFEPLQKLFHLCTLVLDPSFGDDAVPPNYNKPGEPVIACPVCERESTRQRRLL